MKKFLKNFFSRYLLYGIICILISAIIDSYFNDCLLKSIITNTLSTFGIALAMGSIFDFSINSDSFTSFVSGILKKIIITKDFLAELKQEEKKNVLELLITPTDKQIEECSSIDTYYKKSIDSFVNLYSQQFKTNLNIYVTAKMENGVVVCVGSVTHRRYKINGRYQPIETNFEKTDSKMSNTYILLPNGDRVDLKENEDIEVKNQAELKCEKIGKKYMTIIPETYNIYDYITLYKEIKEVGYDHWNVFNWSSLTPCDGITFELQCLDGLIVKEYKVFDNPKLYEITVNQEKDRITILSSGWLNEYTGFTILISKKEDTQTK